LLQDVFVEALRGVRNLREPSALRAWLTRVTFGWRGGAPAGLVSSRSRIAEAIDVADPAASPARIEPPAPRWPTSWPRFPRAPSGLGAALRGGEQLEDIAARCRCSLATVSGASPTCRRFFEQPPPTCRPCRPPGAQGTSHAAKTIRLTIAAVACAAARKAASPGHRWQRRRASGGQSGAGTATRRRVRAARHRATPAPLRPEAPSPAPRRAVDGGAERGPGGDEIFDDALVGGANLRSVWRRNQRHHDRHHRPHTAAAPRCASRFRRRGYTGARLRERAPRRSHGYAAVVFWARPARPHSLKRRRPRQRRNQHDFSAEWNALVLTTTWTKYVRADPLPSSSPARPPCPFRRRGRRSAYTCGSMISSTSAPVPPCSGHLNRPSAAETLEQTGRRSFPGRRASSRSWSAATTDPGDRARVFRLSTSDATVVTSMPPERSRPAASGPPSSRPRWAEAAAGGITVNVSAASTPTVAAPAPTAQQRT